jgi:hypothetical protein
VLTASAEFYSGSKVDLAFQEPAVFRVRSDLWLSWHALASCLARARVAPDAHLGRWSKNSDLGIHLFASTPVESAGITSRGRTAAVWKDRRQATRSEADRAADPTKASDLQDMLRFQWT